MRKAISYLLTLCIVLSLGVMAFAESKPIGLYPGDIIAFGSYEQDDITDNGLEPIDWIVLDIQGAQALFVSKYGLDCKPYHEKMESVRWGDCTLREWLKDSFLTTAFSENQQSAIVLSKIDNSAEQAGRYFQYVQAKDTQDQVFLLSGAELEKYSGIITEVEPTSFAMKNKPATSGGSYYWWLRGVTKSEINFDTGKSFVQAQISCGKNTNDTVTVDTESVLVRPAMWVDLIKMPVASEEIESENGSIREESVAPKPIPTPTPTPKTTTSDNGYSPELEEALKTAGSLQTGLQNAFDFMDEWNKTH